METRGDRMFKLVDNQIFWYKSGIPYIVGDGVLVGLISLRSKRAIVVFSDEFRMSLLHTASTAGVLKIMTVLEELRDFLLEIEGNT